MLAKKGYSPLAAVNIQKTPSSGVSVCVLAYRKNIFIFSRAGYRISLKSGTPKQPLKTN